jgi:hypothetical protein
VAIDAAADPVPCFSDLGNAIRRCRIDFNVEISLDISAFQPSKNNGFAKQHFVVGEIVYSEEHVKTLGWLDTSLAARTGVIVYVKSSLVQDEKDLGPDVRQYGIENSDFPQQSTVDQWFDEAQFESYRQLGRHSILAAFERASLKAEPSNSPLLPSTQALLAVQYQLDGINSAQTAQPGMRRTTAPTISPDAATTLFELVKQARV